MAKKLTIELGNSLVRIMEINWGPAPTIGKRIEFPITEGLVSDGVILNTERLAAVMREKILEAGIKTKNTIFTINSSRIASREVPIPKIATNKIQQVVETNASTYFPVNIEDYNVAYRILGDSEEDPTKKQVQIFIAPKKMLQDYILLSEEAGLDVESFDCAGNSVFQIAKAEAKTGTRLIVKIDEHSSQITVIKDQTQVMQRNISYGIDSVVNDVMVDKGFDYIEALRFLSENDVVTIDENDEEVSVFEELASGISKTIDFYNLNHGGDAIERIYITGIGGDIRGISGEINRITNILASPLKVSASLNVEKAFKGAPYGQFIDCFGAGIAPLGFIEKKKKNKAASGTDMSRVAALIFGGSIFVSIAITALSLFSYMNAKSDNQEAKLYLKSLAYVADTYNAHQTVLAENMYLKELDDATHNRNDEIVLFIEELEEKMPSDIRVTNMACTEEEVLITLEVSTKNEAAKVVDAMLDFNSISDVYVSSVSEDTSEDGLKTVSLTLQCKYYPYGFNAVAEVEE